MKSLIANLKRNSKAKDRKRYLVNGGRFTVQNERKGIRSIHQLFSSPSTLYLIPYTEFLCDLSLNPVLTNKAKYHKVNLPTALETHGQRTAPGNEAIARGA